MIKAPIDLQDLRRRLYVKAKAAPTWRFWGLYVHVCRMETLWEAYRMAKKNDGAPGIDGVTLEAIEESGADSFLRQIRDELVTTPLGPLGPGSRGSTERGLCPRPLESPSSAPAWANKSQAVLPLLQRSFQDEDLREAFRFYFRQRPTDFDLAKMARNRLAQNELMQHFCEETHIPLLDLTPVFQQKIESGRNLYFPDDSHWNAAGQEVAADELAKFLRQQGLEQ